MIEEKRIECVYYAQTTEYACGPACLRMVLGYFGVSSPEKELTALLNTNPEIGTITDEMPRVAADKGFSVFEKKNCSIGEIESYLTEEMPVIVDFIEPSEEDRHFAVVVGFDRTKLILNDPWNGEGFEISRDEFDRRWGSPKNRYRRWMMAISDKKIMPHPLHSFT